MAEGGGDPVTLGVAVPADNLFLPVDVNVELTPATLALSAASDTAPVGDGRTEAATVTLEGSTAAGAILNLGNRSTTAAADGSFSFAGVALSLGDNTLTVRATEKLAQSFLSDSSGKSDDPKKTASREVDIQIRAIANRLREHLATHVAVQHSAKKGKIEIEYYGDDDLQRLLELIGLGTSE